MIWHKYDRDSDTNKLPTPGELVWLVVSEDYGYEVPGYWDLYWRDYTGNDDISVLYWGELDYPAWPADYDEWYKEVHGRD